MTGMTQSAIYADLLAHCVSVGDMWQDGTLRSTDNDFCAVPLNRPQIVQKFGPTKLVRPFRVRNAISFSQDTQSDADKTRRIRGAGNRYRTA